MESMVKMGLRSFLLPLTFVVALAGCGSDELLDPSKHSGTVAIDTEPSGLPVSWMLVTPTGDTIEGDGASSMRGMVLGRYAVAWGDLEGYRTPAGTFGELADGETLVLIGAYEPESFGTIHIDVVPDGLEAEWALVSEFADLYTGRGDTTLTNVPAGEYTMGWMAMPGYATPQPNPVKAVLAANGEHTFVGNFQAISGGGVGDLSVNPEVDGEPLLAPWSMTGPGGFADSGVGPKSYTGRAAGEYTVTWGNLTGYDTPTAQTAVLTANQTLTMSGRYKVSTGSVTIDVTPDTIDAPWTLIGPGDSSYSGTGDASLPAVKYGAHTFTWGYVEGWDPPSPRQFSVSITGSGDQVSVTGTYTESGVSGPTGTVTVTPQPAGLAAPWNLSGPNGFSESGVGAESLTGVPTGSYTLTWQAVEGYVTPAAQSGSLTAGTTLAFEGSYSEATGTVSVQPAPEGLNVGWFLSGPQGYQRNGFGAMELTGMLAGQYTITWGNLDGYVTPAKETATLNANQTLTFAATFVLATGVVEVSPSPAGIDAPWDLAGPGAFSESGTGSARFEDAPVGAYSITWGDVDGYATPTPQALNLNLDQTIVFGGTYQPTSSTITLDPNPDSINAPWTLTDASGNVRSGSGDVSLTVEPGSYTVRWGDVTGWLPPSPREQSVAVLSGELKVVSATYTEDPDLNQPDTGTVVISVEPNSASWSLSGPEGFAQSGSGDRTFTEVLVGEYSLTWQSLSGYVTPSPAQVSQTLNVDQTITFSGAYGVPGSPSISNVTGSLSEGGSLTISGSNFGTKVPAAPLVWDTFENGNVGEILREKLAVIGQWDWGAGADNVYYSTDVGYGGSGKAAKHDWGVSYNSSLCQNNDVTGFPVVYMDWKTYFPESNTGGISNWKPFRLYGPNDRKMWYTSMQCGVTNTDFFGIPTAWDSSWSNSDKGRWVHFQYALDEATAPGSRDGRLRGYKDGRPYMHNGDNYDTKSQYNVNFSQIRIGHYFTTGARDGCDPLDSSVTYSDNVYIDTTWARVEVGNNPSYEACTQREIQIPTAWSSSSITVDANTGAFGTGELVYVFVVNGSGEISSGYGPFFVE